MRARIDIGEAEARTKIRAKYLRAMENEEWDLLPGAVYVKSFLRTYGDLLGLDSRALVDEYKRRYERPSDQDMRPISSLGRDRGRRRRPRLGPLGAIVLVLAAVVVALFVVGSLKTGNSSNTTSTSVTGARHTARSARAKGHHAHGRNGATPAPPKPKTVSLKLVATGTVYVCVVDGHGKKLIPGVIYSAGQSIPTAKAGKLLLTLGNDAVQMTINGKHVPVAVGSPIGYELTPRKTSPLSRARMPTCT